MTDGNGQTMTEEISKAVDLGEVGASGLRQYSGVLAEEYLRDLQGDKARKAFREMSDNDPVVGAILFAVDMLMRQVDWRTEPASDDPKDQEIADFVWSCTQDMSSSWHDTLSSVLSFLPFGWSYHEVVYKLRKGKQKDPRLNSDHDDGRVGWRKLPIRSQDTLVKWQFDGEGGIQGMVQLVPTYSNYVTIPIEKSLLFRTTTQKQNPEGRSVLRNAYRPWFMKKRIEEIEAVGIERDLAGLPVAYVPAKLFLSKASADEKAALEEMKLIVRNIKRDRQEGVVMPIVYDENGHKLYELTLLTTGGRRAFDTDQVISRYDQRIAMTILADFVLLGHEKVGSYALGSAKMELFSLGLSAWLDGIASVFNAYAIPRLLELNGYELARAPKLAHGDVQQIDLKDLADFVEKLAGAGAPLFPDDALEDHLRRVAGLPQRQATEEVMT